MTKFGDIQVDYEPIAHDPFKHQSIWLNFTASALRSIWLSVLFFTGLATAIVLIDRLDSSVNLGISSTMLTVLGTTIGFVISYRTSSAYDRYWEGRRMWSEIILNSRTLARMIWLHVPSYMKVPEDPANIPEEEKVKATLEKKTMINIIEAFAISVKHYLRGEDGVFYQDLWPLVAYLPKYHLPSAIISDTEMLSTEPHEDNSERLAPRPSDLSNTSQRRPSTLMGTLGSTSASVSFADSKSALNQSFIKPNSHPVRMETLSAPLQHSGIPHPPIPLKPSRNPPPWNIIDDLFTFLIPIRSMLKYVSKRARRKELERRKSNNMRKGRKRPALENENLPLELIMLMSGYTSSLQRRKIIDVPTTNALLLGIQGLSSSLVSLERILTTPIPFGYQIHLKHTVWVYLFALPWQLQPTLGWVTIPAVAIAAFIFLGLLSIGQEIENPFGYDLNDLNLDYFCRNIIHREMAELTSHTPESSDPDSFLFTTGNVPLFPHDPRGVEELSQVSMSELERLLAGARAGLNRTKTYRE
ncbi:UPF0187-domain-containing protein [Atractiella rhizophila]|nr:UPF0187-domain-containing protein [Atractiella rhizophila]